MAQEPSVLIERARRHFFEEGVAPEPGIAPHILRSWRRCHSLGRNVQDAAPVSRGDLSERRDAAAWLLRCAQPELDALSEHVVSQGCVVILSDATGLILEEIGSPEFLPKAERVALLPGVDWSEARRGTNAIGTALAERDAVLVLGREHFLAQNGALGCAAAPILTAQGELAGVLDISGESIRVDVHALGLARMAAAQVEHRMLSQHADGELVHFHARPGLLGTAREGLLSTRDGRIVGLNRAAVALLGSDWSSLLGLPVEHVFGARWSRLQRAPGLFAAPDGRQWAVAVDGLRDGVRGNGARIGATPRETALAAIPRANPAADPDVLAPMLKRATRVVDAGLSVLITGETGSGKDWFARRLHGASRRAGGPFVAVNCAALPETLIEAELFGYEEGAFTGARRRGMPGRLREAHGGVLFLDEIGDMPLPLQTRLLRVLEDRQVRPLGATRDVALDFSLVCATHHDLPALVAAGRFREDLLYRLRGFAVALPALRHRADRRALILQIFEATGAGARGLSLSTAALDLLDRHEWRGNVRELASVLRAVVALAEPGTTLEATDLLLEPRSNAAETGASDGPRGEGCAEDRPQPLAAMARDAIRDALAMHGGRVAEAAASLGVHRSTLYRHLRRDRSSGDTASDMSK